MKKITYILFFLSLLSYSQATYYVANNGSSGNTGTTTASPWTMAKAIQEVGPGDIVWIKKGIYLDLFTTIGVSGTALNPITFKGYNTTPNDVNSTSGPTYTWNTPIDGNTLPLFRENRSGLIGSGTAFNISGNYIVFENIKIQYYKSALFVNGNNNTIRNVQIHQVGALDPSTPNAYQGKGIQVFGINSILENNYVEDCDAEGISIKSDDNFLSGNEVHGNDTPNTIDYYLLVQGGSRNQILNTTIWRHGNLKHYGHGICFKSPNPTTENIVDGFTITNTNLEFQFQGVYGNTARNGTVVKLADGGPSEGIAGLVVANAAHDNHFEDIFIDNCLLTFRGWDDGLPGQENGLSGYNNTFNQITINSMMTAVSFYFFRQSEATWPANDNKFYNCTFYRKAESTTSAEWIFERTRPASGLEFVNCIFDGFTQYGSARGTLNGTPLPDRDIIATWTNNNFFNSAVGSIQGTQINTTTLNPLFTNAPSKDFTLQAGSPLKGEGVATPYLSAGNDLGAAQTSGGPVGDTTPPTITEVTESEILETSIQVEFRFDEGSTGQIEWGLTTGYGNFTTLETNFLTFHRQTITDLTPGTLYYYRILGEDAAGNSVTGSQRSATTLGGGENPDPEPVGILGDLRGLFLKSKKFN